MAQRFIFFFTKAALLLPLLINITLGFGQNKVQYTDFSWKLLVSPHFNVYYHLDQDKLPEISLFWVENAFKELSSEFNYSPEKRFPLIIYGDPNLFAQTNIITEVIPEGVGGFTEMFKNRIVIPFNGNYSELRHVLHHELVHGFCFSILYSQFGGTLLRNTEQQAPLWFMEGLAEYLSSGWDIEADMFVMDQIINSTIPVPGPELGGYLAYKGGQSFLNYLSDSRGKKPFFEFIDNFKTSRSVDRSIKDIYGKTTEEIGREWIQELKKNYWPEIGHRELPSSIGQVVTDHKETHSNYNLRPRLSPDGSKVAYFSDLKDFSKILITDRKGKVLHTISQTGYGGYFETFHPFRSGLSWSPDGRELVFVTKGNGNDEIRIVNVSDRSAVRKITTSLTSISSPDWSPDGSMFVYSGVEKGKSDLYIYNLTSAAITRLTNDFTCESDPKFTTDSKSVIFSSQDTSGRADSISSPYGNTPSDIVKIDIATLKTQYLTRTPWNEKHPCVSPDGSSCAFVSDRNGIENIYVGRIDSITDAKPLTDYTGGCSNPDWRGGTLVYTLFNHSGWDIWLIEKPESKLKKDSLKLTRFVESSLDTSKPFFLKVPIQKNDSLSSDNKFKKSSKKPHSKPDKSLPDTKGNTLVEILPQSDTVKTDSALQDSTVSEKKTTTVNSDTSALKIGKTDSLIDKPDTSKPLIIPSPKPYRISFSPDIVSVGLGINTYYGYAGQWVISLSDLLGDHRITLAGDVQGNFKDYLHLFGSYFYLKERFDFGLGLYFSKDLSYADIYGDYIYRDTDFGAFIAAQYPFSLYSRIEFQALYRDTKRVPVDTLLPSVKTTSIIPSLTYTFDNILWGITGPINGVRASVNALVSPPISKVTDQFVSFEADIRAYLHIVKRFVWANRLFVGASASLDDSSSKRRYYLGGNDNWLFYNVDLDQYEKNMSSQPYSDFVTPFRGWNYIGLSGTRVALLNTEFRFPFVKEISIVWPLPMQIRYISGAFFTDIGNAWSEGEKHNGMPLPDKIYGGIGFGFRANLGIFILRYDRGWPTDFKYFVKAPTNYFSLGAEF